MAEIRQSSAPEIQLKMPVLMVADQKAVKGSIHSSSSSHSASIYWSLIYQVHWLLGVESAKINMTLSLKSGQSSTTGAMKEAVGMLKRERLVPRRRWCTEDEFWKIRQCLSGKQGRKDIHPVHKYMSIYKCTHVWLQSNGIGSTDHSWKFIFIAF